MEDKRYFLNIYNDNIQSKNKRSPQNIPYVPCFEAFFPKLNKNVFVIADNMIFPPHSRPEAEAYRKRVRETSAFDTVLLPMGSGVEVSRML